MKVKIFKSEEVVYEGEAEKVTVPAQNGEMTILPHHISIVTNLQHGRLIVHKKGGEKFQTEIGGGVCSFSDDCLSVLAEG
ncbi:MAG: F0F1 ATP synthase subunit epsilon [Alphaproteobacteria bacterium]|nr:F0F1 ATP synthase subunit epsilon [Alphaproteobacteria bacterium]MCR4556029.1 F0F1 ATP synthase subunit epsilon [Alphaproteobacteria bacterium]